MGLSGGEGAAARTGWTSKAASDKGLAGVTRARNSRTGAFSESAALATTLHWGCGDDEFSLQQSAALSCIGQRSWPALQQAICSVAVAVAPSTQVAHADVRTPATTSNEANARILRTIPCIVCRDIRPVKSGVQNFTSAGRSRHGGRHCIADVRKRGGPACS